MDTASQDMRCCELVSARLVEHHVNEVAINPNTRGQSCLFRVEVNLRACGNLSKIGYRVDIDEHTRIVRRD